MSLLSAGDGLQIIGLSNLMKTMGLHRRRGLFVWEIGLRRKRIGDFIKSSGLIMGFSLSTGRVGGARIMTEGESIFSSLVGAGAFSKDWMLF